MRSVYTGRCDLLQRSTYKSNPLHNWIAMFLTDCVRCQGCTYTDPQPGICGETAVAGSGVDHDACLAVSGHPNSTACSAVLVSGGAVPACTYTTDSDQGSCTDDCSAYTSGDPSSCNGIAGCTHTPFVVLTTGTCTATAAAAGTTGTTATPSTPLCGDAALQTSRTQCNAVTANGGCTFAGGCDLNPAGVASAAWSGCDACPAGQQSAGADLPAVPATCEDCPAGRYKQWDGPEACTACASNEVPTNRSLDSCGCDAGYTMATAAAGAGGAAAPAGCVACAAGKYKGDLGQMACTDCAAGTVASSEASDNPRDCPCEPGYMYSYDDTTTGCVACTAGKYKRISGPAACDDCAAGSHVAVQVGYTADTADSRPHATAGAATLCEQCGVLWQTSRSQRCETSATPAVVTSCTTTLPVRRITTDALEPSLESAHGGGGSSVACTTCPNAQVNHSAPVLSCPGCKHGYVATGASCVACVAGKYNENGACIACPEGKYRGAGVDGCRTCPSGSTTATAGATSVASCVCLPGMVMVHWQEAVQTTSATISQSVPKTDRRHCVACGPGRFALSTQLCFLTGQATASASYCGASNRDDSRTITTGTCSFCPIDTFSTGWQDTCTGCPAHSTTQYIPLSAQPNHAQWTYAPGLAATTPPRFLRRRNYETSPTHSTDANRGALATNIGACYCNPGYAGEITRQNHTCTLCGPGSYGVTGRALRRNEPTPASPWVGKFDPNRLPRDGQSTCSACGRGRYKGSSGAPEALELAGVGATECATGESPDHYPASMTGGSVQILDDPCYRAVTVLAGEFDRLDGYTHARAATAIPAGATMIINDPNNPSSPLQLLASFKDNGPNDVPGFTVEFWDGDTAGSSATEPKGCSTSFSMRDDSRPDSQEVIDEWRVHYNTNTNPQTRQAVGSERLVCGKDLIPEMSQGTGTGRMVFSPQLLSSWGQCRPCPPNTDTAGPGATGLRECICKPGTHGTIDPNDVWFDETEANQATMQNPFFRVEANPNGNGQVMLPTCMACPAGQHAGAAGSANCTQCPIARYAVPPTSAMDSDPVWGTLLEYTTYVEALKTDYALANTYDIGMDECSACPEYSTTGNTTGAASHTACLCEPGYHGAVDNPNSICRPCAIGRFGVGGLLDGQERPCEMCPDGRYSGDSGQAECGGLCPAGTGSDPGSFNASHCLECASGRVSGTGGGCVYCPAGTIANGEVPRLFSTCDLCPLGTYSRSGDGNCTSCQLGRSDMDRDPVTECTDCAVGRSMNETGAVDCTRCNIGEEAKPGSVYCSQCAAGKYDHDNDAQSYCMKCAKAYYSVGEGNTACTPCPGGRFSDEYALKSALQCMPCPPGQWSYPAAMSCMDCEVGTYRNKSDGCVPCELEGLVCPLSGMIRPWLMPGYYMPDGDVESGDVSPVKCTPPEACYSYAEVDKSCACPTARDIAKCANFEPPAIWTPAACAYPYVNEAGCINLVPQGVWNMIIQLCEFPDATDENACIDLVRPATWNAKRTFTSEEGAEYGPGVCEYTCISQEACAKFAGAGAQPDGGPIGLVRSEWDDTTLIEPSWAEELWDALFGSGDGDEELAPPPPPACILFGARTKAGCEGSQKVSSLVRPAVWTAGFCAYPSQTELSLIVSENSDYVSGDSDSKFYKQYVAPALELFHTGDKEQSIRKRLTDGAILAGREPYIGEGKAYPVGQEDDSDWTSADWRLWYIDENRCGEMDPPGVWKSGGTMMKQLQMGNTALKVGTPEMRAVVKQAEEGCTSTDFAGCRPSCSNASNDFWLVTPADTMENSEKWCAQRGGHLASIHSDEEFATLAEFVMLETKSKYPWLGGLNCKSRLHTSDKNLCGVAASVRIHERFDLQVYDDVADAAECCDRCKQYTAAPCGGWSYSAALDQCELKTWDDSESPVWTRALCLAIPEACSGTCSDPNAATELECLALGSCSDVRATSEAACDLRGTCDNPSATDQVTCEQMVPPAIWTTDAAVWTSAGAMWTSADDVNTRAQLEIDFGDDAAGIIATNQTEAWVSGGKVLLSKHLDYASNEEFECSWRDGTPWDWQKIEYRTAHDTRANSNACMAGRKATVLTDTPTALVNEGALQLFRAEQVEVVSVMSFRTGVGRGIVTRDPPPSAAADSQWWEVRITGARGSLASRAEKGIATADQLFVHPGDVDAGSKCTIN